MFLRPASLIAVVLVMSLLPIGTHTVRADVGNLTAALISASDAPSGYKNPHYKVYTKYVGTMRLKIKGQLSTAGATCSIDARYRKFGWKQGIIQAFDAPPGFFTEFQYCGYLFSTTRGALQAWALALADLKRSEASTSGMKFKRFSVPRIGDEAIGLGYVGHGFTRKKSTLALYIVAWRHANALLINFYAGAPTFSTSSLIRVAQHSDHHL